MSADRTPEQIIGHDRLMQLVFEGYAVVRADHIAEKEARTAYKPQVIDYADSGVSELVLTDEPHVYAEAATVFVIRDMETRRISGFQWFTKNIPNPQLPTSPKGGPDHG